MFLKSLSSCETFSTDVKMESQSSSLLTGESSSILKTQVENANSATPNTVGMTIKEGSELVTKIILLGERHSGTNWITDHLEECFGKDIEVSMRYLHDQRYIFILTLRTLFSRSGSSFLCN